MGDLQCPARVYVAGPSAARGGEDRLAHERIAAVYELAEPAADVRAWLEDIADRHRGEAVLVVGDLGALAAALDGLVAGWSARTSTNPQAVLGLEADADGWRVVGP